jgi:hypothetical protein
MPLAMQQSVQRSATVIFSYADDSWIEGNCENPIDSTHIARAA